MKPMDNKGAYNTAFNQTRNKPRLIFALVVARAG